MSIHINSTGSKYFRIDSAPAANAPLSFAAWVQFTNLSVDRYVLELSGTYSHCHRIQYIQATNVLALRTRAGGSSMGVDGSAPSTGVWIHVAGVFASTTSRTFYINGASQGTSTTSGNPTLTRFTPGQRTDGGLPTGYSMLDGYLADVAVWTEALSAAQVASLASGASPLIVEPASLWSFGALLAAPAVAAVGPAYTLNNSPVAGPSHPALYPA